MTKIKDVTNSPEDWYDFWYHSEDIGLSYQLDQTDFEELQKELKQKEDNTK